MVIFKLLRAILLGIFIGLLPPFIGGIYYGFCGDHHYEQAWLDSAVDHLKDMRAACDDPDLCDILDYTIARYNKVGAWDVMVAPCVRVYRDGNKTIGINVPWCPGITIDPEVLTWPVHEGAKVLVHEATHDYWPYLHPFVDSRTDKIDRL